MMSDGHLESAVYKSLLDTINNVTPFQKHLSKGTCNRLLSMFEHMSKPTFFLGDDGKRAALQSLLRTCNALVRRNLNGKMISFHISTPIILQT